MQAYAEKKNTGSSIKSKIHLTADRKIFLALSFILITSAGIICLLPFLLIISGSFTKESSVLIDGYRLIPKEFSVEGYKLLLKSSDSLIRAYGVTIAVMTIGTSIGLFLTAMTSYVLWRKDFHWRNKIAFFFFFTTLFSGGLVPWYILMIKYLQLKDNIIVLILSNLFNVFYILIMRNFMKSIPHSVFESAKIDGAGDFQIFTRIILPLCTPALATIGLFMALNYWNEWYSAMLFINNEKLFPLQYHLYSILNSANFAAAVAGKSGIRMPDMPTESFKLVMTVVTTGPIIFLYPFIQKYFIRGITIGAVKG